MQCSLPPISYHGRQRQAAGKKLALALAAITQVTYWPSCTQGQRKNTNDGPFHCASRSLHQVCPLSQHAAARMITTRSPELLWGALGRGSTLQQAALSPAVMCAQYSGDTHAQGGHDRARAAATIVACHELCIPLKLNAAHLYTGCAFSCCRCFLREVSSGVVPIEFHPQPTLSLLHRDRAASTVRAHMTYQRALIPSPRHGCAAVMRLRSLASREINTAISAAQLFNAPRTHSVAWI